MSDTAMNRRPRRLGRRLLTLGLAAVVAIVVASWVATYFQNAGGSRQTQIDALPGASVGRSISLSPQSFVRSESSPALAYDASITLTNDRPGELIERVSTIVHDNGGDTVYLSIQSSDEDTAAATFRVPNADLPRIFNDIAAVAPTSDKRLTARDIAGNAPAPTSPKYATLAVDVQPKTVGIGDRKGFDAFAHALGSGWQATAAGFGLVLAAVGFAVPLTVLVLLLIGLAGAGVFGIRRLWRRTKPMFV